MKKYVKIAINQLLQFELNDFRNFHNNKSQMQQQYPIDCHTLLPIHAGQVHYSRIPRQYWQHRIKMIKGLGLNALSVYIIWNYHQISRGVFDFSHGNQDLMYFLQLAQKYNMMVLFRPGPYVCAEWDFGGLPARLLGKEGLEIRANNQFFIEETRIWFQALAPIIKKYMRCKNRQNGCIVMLQIQNQYGFYGSDKSYMQALRKLWKELDISLTEYYVDWIQNIEKCHWKGANIGINNFSKQEQEDKVRVFEKEGFILGGEIYSGWMTHWSEKWGGKSIEKVLKDYQYLLSHNHSFAMYMVHGGTNFGLSAGANGLKDKVNDYWGAITSYDYDAPINQQGAATKKYYALRELFKKYIKDQFPQIPEPIPMIQIPQITLQPQGNLLNNFPIEAVQNINPLVFQSTQLQMFNQGIVVYQTMLKLQQDYVINVVAHDFGIVYLGEKVIQVISRTISKNHTINITKQMLNQHGQRLRFLIEASGHINFDRDMLTDKKGLYTINGLQKIEGWTMWKFKLDYQIMINWKCSINEEDIKCGKTYPRVYKGVFNLMEVGDTYLDVSQYGKGYIWVNGHNLGRYWDLGPQKRLFCPGVWLNSGQNTIVVFNVYGNAGSPIKGVKNLYDTPIVYQ